jgi:hypothetical protein
MAELLINLSLLAFASFVQNAAFTWVSRARNQGDMRWLLVAAVASNSVFFVIQVFLMSAIWRALTAGAMWKIAVTGAVYVAFTSWGTTAAHRALVRRGK